MAKKKKAAFTPPNETKLQEKIDLLLEENETLEGEHADCLADIGNLKTSNQELEEEAADLEAEVKHLKEQIASDTGIPDDPSPRIAELENQINQFKLTNKDLAAQLKEALKVGPGVPTSSSTSVSTVDSTDLDPQLVAACVGKVIDGNGNPYDPSNFNFMVDTFVQQAITLAKNIQSSTSPSTAPSTTQEEVE